MSRRTAASTGLRARSVTRSGCYRLRDASYLTGGEKLAQVTPRERPPDARDRLRRSFGDDLAARFPALGTEIDHVVRGLDHVEVVLDDDDRVSRVHEAVQHLEQPLAVRELKSGRGLVQAV